MPDALLRVAFFLGVCLAAGLVQGASRASEPVGILRHGLRSFVSLAGGIGLFCGALWLLLRVTQS